MNDLVLIILWSMAAMEDPIYVPVIINFMIFFLNDMYGFISWKKERICNIKNLQFTRKLKPRREAMALCEARP